MVKTLTIHPVKVAERVLESQRQLEATASLAVFKPSLDRRYFRGQFTKKKPPVWVNTVRVSEVMSLGNSE